MQMTIKQLMECATQLREQADSKEYTAERYRQELNALKDPYEDFSTMPEDVKKKAYDLERVIKKRQEQATAYMVLADAIEEKKVLVNLGVNL